MRDSNVFTKIIKEAPRRSITVMSSLNEISTDQLGNRMVVVRGEALPKGPNARGRVQNGGPPGWLEESDPAGCDLYVMDGPCRLP